LLVAWGAGVACFLLPVIIGLWQIRALRRSSLPWQRGELLAEPLAMDAGIHQRVEVLLHEALSGPMTCGVLRPAIVLPRDAETWNPEDLDRAIVHELEHVRRADLVSHCLARVTCAVYWFHPLAWIAWRKLALEAERSCDDAVLLRSEATAYAAQLVGLAKRVLAAHGSPLLAMANRGDLAARVGAVLDREQRRGRVGMFSAALACGAAAALVVVVSPLTLVGAPQATSDRLSSEATPKFEVASIRPCDPSGPIAGGRGAPPATSLRLVCNTVVQLIRSAYDTNADGLASKMIPSSPISGGPSWINSDRYTILAKADGAVPQPMMSGPMLRTLLEDRFQLRVRREIREVPVYELTMAKGGPKLKPSQEGSCPTPNPAGGSCPGSLWISKKGSNMVIDQQETIAGFIRMLSQRVGRPVIDKTGINGSFDFHLEFAPDEFSGGTRGDPAIQAGALPDSSGPTIFTAVQEQLGLKLESARGPGEFLVVDHVERPSEN
jgi:uncharacterized protein (TIGR03435 family)